MFSEEKKCFTEYLNYFNWKKIVYENKPGAVYKNGHALPYQAPRKHFGFFLRFFHWQKTWNEKTILVNLNESWK